jgi:hypothetical protein
MKLDHKTLKKIIKEELYKVLRESQFLPGEEKEKEEVIKSLMDRFGLSWKEAEASIEKTGQELMKDLGYAMQHKELESNYNENQELLKFFSDVVANAKEYHELRKSEHIGMSIGKLRPWPEQLEEMKQNAIKFITKENKTDLEEKLFNAYHEEILSEYDSNGELQKIAPELAKLYKDAEKGVFFMDMQTPSKIKELNKKVSEIKKQIDDEVFEKLIYALSYLGHIEEYETMKKLRALWTEHKYIKKEEKPVEKSPYYKVDPKEYRENREKWEERLKAILQEINKVILELAAAQQEEYKNLKSDEKTMLRINYWEQFLPTARGEASWADYEYEKEQGSYDRTPWNFWGEWLEYGEERNHDTEKGEVEEILLKAFGETYDGLRDRKEYPFEFDRRRR